MVPSTFHQCVKFLVNGVEITIHGDPNPFQHCNNLRASTKNQVPINQEAPITSQIESLTISKKATTSQVFSEQPLQIKEEGCGEYSLFRNTSTIPLSTYQRNFGRPQPYSTRVNKGKEIIRYLEDCSFIKWDDIQEEELDEDVNSWLYKDEEGYLKINLPLDQYGNGFKMLQRHSY